MLVCHCKGVSERELRTAIEAGACTQRDVARHCGAGTGCGGCRPVIEELLEERHAEPTACAIELAFAAS